MMQDVIVKADYKIQLDTGNSTFALYILNEETTVWELFKAKYSSIQSAEEAYERTLKLKKNKIEPMEVIFCDNYNNNKMIVSKITSIISSSTGFECWITLADKRRTKLYGLNGFYKISEHNQEINRKLSELREQIRMLEASYEKVTEEEIKQHFKGTYEE